MDLFLNVWRQENEKSEGKIVRYQLKGVSEDCSFLEMMDLLNEQLIGNKEEPVAFDHDCREGICGSCSLVINGVPHSKETRTTTCQLHMRSFKDGDEIFIEPFRAKGFPIVKDLVVNRSAFDRIIQAGGYVSVNTGSVPDANATLISKKVADEAFDAATCIGCGACVASCKNASAMLFVSAKVKHLGSLPQGAVESDRVVNMVNQMDLEGFGACTNQYECGAACPVGISVDNIAWMNKEYLLKNLSDGG